MGWYKNEEWETLLVACDDWKAEAAEHVNDFGLFPIRNIRPLTRQIIAWCDARPNIHVDPTPLWDLCCKITNYHPGRKRVGGAIGPPPGPAELNDLMWRCVGVIDRLMVMGIVKHKPVPTDRPADPTNEGKPQLTEPMTRKRIGSLFNVHRNAVNKEVLSKYYHEITEINKIQMRVADMPATYQPETR